MGDRRRAEDCAGTGGAGARRVRAAAVPRPAPALHRLRGRPGQRRAAQDHRGLPSVPCGERGGGGNGARQRHGESAVREERALLGGPNARRQAGRPPRRRGLAHARQRQELLDALLRRAHHPASGDGEPDAGGADRPQRSGRPALRPVPALPRYPRPDAGAGRDPRAAARAAGRGERRRGVHDDPEVLPEKGETDAAR